MSKYMALAFGIIAAFCIHCGVARANPLHVSTNGHDEPGTAGTSWDTAFLTISNAVKQASGGFTILVSNGTYALSQKIVLDKAVTILGVNGPAGTIVDGRGTCQCFNVTAAATISGLTITNGNGTWDSGGGVNMSVTNVLVTNCIITGCIVTNSGRYGGGIYANNGGLIVGCTLIGNRSNTRGGGAEINNSAKLIDCDVAFNTANLNGGGVNVINNSHVIQCRIYGNTSRADGGGGAGYWFGLFSDSLFSNNTANGSGGIAQGWVSNCIVVGNSATNGNAGGISLSANQPGQAAVDCLVVSNDCTGIGGGVYIDTDARLINCRILANRAGNQSGGVHVNKSTNALIRNCLIALNYSQNPATASGVGLGAPTKFTIESCTIISNGVEYGLMLGNTNGYVTNCIIASNGWNSLTDINIAGALSAVTNNFYSSCCPSVALPSSQGNITANPLLADSLNGDGRLTRGSPCVNAGINLGWMEGALDLDGHPRIYAIRGTNVDMGAYEYYVPPGAVFWAR